MTLSIDIVQKAVLIFLALLVFTAIATTAALAFKPVSVTATCLLLLMLGLVSEWIVFRIPNPWQRIAYPLIVTFPNWQIFWLPSGEAAPAATTLFFTGCYAMILTLGILMIGSTLFCSQEHKA